MLNFLNQAQQDAFVGVPMSPYFNDGFTQQELKCLEQATAVSGEAKIKLSQCQTTFTGMDLLQCVFSVGEFCPCFSDCFI